MAEQTPALLSAQGGLASDVAGRCASSRAMVPARFCGVGVCPVGINFLVFCWLAWSAARDRDSEDAVVFPKIHTDAYFGHTGSLPGTIYQLRITPFLCRL